MSRCRSALPTAVAYAIVLALGAPTRAEFRVNTYTTGEQGAPSATADGLGNFIIVWRNGPFQGTGEVAGQRYDAAGAPLGAEFQVNTTTAGYQGPGDVAADAAGNFVVVWQSGTGATAAVVGRRYDAAGSPLAGEFQVNATTAGSYLNPEVAMDASGNFVVLWSIGQIMARRYDANGVPLGPEFQVSATAGSDIPRAAVDPAGNMLVVWQGPFGTETDVSGRFYDSAGMALGAEFLVNAYTTGDQSLPAVAADSAGNFIVAWQDDRGTLSGHDIRALRYDGNGMILTPDFVVNTYTTSDQLQPAVAVDGSGGFLIAWEDNSITNMQRIFAQRYANTGARLGSEFPVNPNFDAREVITSVAMNAAGTFVIAWTEQETVFDVVAQRNKPDRVIRGSRFDVKNPTGNEDDRRLQAVAKESDSGFGNVLDGDPSVDGATLRVIANGTTSSDETYVLEAAGWEPVRPGRDYRWSDVTGTDADPVRSVALRLIGKRGTARLKILLDGRVGTAPLAVVPPNMGDDGGVILQIGGGGGTYCAPFGGAAGGTELIDTAERWRVVRTTADPACPSP